MERSHALARRAGAALKPTVDVIAGGAAAGGVTGDSPVVSAYDVGIQAGWELDVWGRVRAGRQAAVLSAEAVEADYRFSQHSLSAAVASAYLVAIEAGLQTELTRRTYDNLVEIHRITSIQYENGDVSADQVALARADMASAEAGLAGAEGAQRDALRALELLLGRYPGAELEVRDSLPAVPAPPPAGVPSEILERRPDLIAAERRVAAAFNLLDEAKAAQLPRIALTATGGVSSESLEGLVEPSNIQWALGANLLAPIFQGGALKAQVDVATADQQAAIAAYGQAALSAFREVESGLDQIAVLARRNASLAVAAEQSKEALRIYQVRHEEGDVDPIEVLLVQSQAVGAESSLINAERARLEQWVNLNLALGGSWE